LTLGKERKSPVR